MSRIVRTLGVTLGVLLAGYFLFWAAIGPNPLRSAKSALGLIHAVALLLLLGCAVITQELLALFESARQFPILSQRKRVLLVAMVLAGTVLALCLSFICYPAGAVRVHGFPFATAITDLPAEPQDLPPSLSNVPARDLVRAWAKEMQVGNFVLWLLLPQALLRLSQRAVRARYVPQISLEETEGAGLAGAGFFFLTCLTLIGYVGMIFGDLPEAWRGTLETMRWSATAWENLPAIAAPPLAALASWCLATAWLVRPSRVGRRGKTLWAFLLLCSMLGMPLSCVTTGFASGTMHWRLTP